jgi:hypothetical protein
MKKQLTLSKVAKIATVAAFLFFCLLNLKTVINNNGKIRKSDSDEAIAKNICYEDPVMNDGDCTDLGFGTYFCHDSWFWHDCYGTSL